MQVLEADWEVPGVRAFTTLRIGGYSAAPWDGCNLGDHVGDEPAAVAANRGLLAAHLPTGARIQWLRQVHGSRVVEATGAGTPEADACWSGEPGLACAVLTADCLPVLLAARDGTRVAAAHAGWRGLLGGVLEAVVSALPVPPGELLAWLGPAIGPDAFEDGPEVRDAFMARGAGDSAFRPSASEGRYLADLYALARQRLATAGVGRVTGGGHCTYGEPQHFFSYRRDGRTGRMASLVCIDPR